MSEKDIQKEEHSDFHLKKVGHSDLEDIHPDDLMENVTESRLGSAIVISIAAHILFIGLLSIHYFVLCAQYKTFDPRTAIQAEKDAEEEEERKRKKEEFRKKIEEEAKAQAKKEQAAEAGKSETDAPAKEEGEKKTPKILKEINEVSKERPNSTSLDDLDEDL